MSRMLEGKFGNRNVLPYGVVRSGQRVKVVGLSVKSRKMAVYSQLQLVVADGSVPPAVAGGSE